MTPEEERLRYPIGRFERVTDPLDATARAASIDAIAETPTVIRSLVEGLTEARLDSPYRRGGWTIRQVVHHLPDSHMNAYVRMKLAVTEDTPTVKPYDEAVWAELAEARTAPVAVSLGLLDGLHARWVAFLRALSNEDFRRAYVHPEWGGTVPMFEVLAQYAWHGYHHAAHIRNALAALR